MGANGTREPGENCIRTQRVARVIYQRSTLPDRVSRTTASQSVVAHRRTKRQPETGADQ
jgi:hypothetical protein